jgi:hypothetical protein
MKESDLTNLVRRLGHYITKARSELPASKIAEQWTRHNLIDPLLKELGWDDPFEVFPGDPSVNDDWIDYTLRPSPPKAASLCVEAKPLLSSPPRDRAHEEIKKGLEQTESRASDYFIWTNGDTWLLFAVKLPDAPFYEINIGQAGRDEDYIQEVSEKLRFLSREMAVNNPEAIIQEILAYWREIALPQVFTALSEGHAEETIKLVRRVLPPGLDISNQEILHFLRECRWKETDTGVTGSGREKPRKFKPCDEEWEKLVTNGERKYVKMRENLLDDSHKKMLCKHLISDNYKPFHHSVTYSLIGLARRGADTKGPVGSVIGYLKTLGFIEAEDPHSRPSERTYKRVDAAIPYLKRILQSE